MRAAIYARFSSDNQSDHSIEDQVRVCTREAVKLGLTVVDTFTDFAISGTQANRPGFLALAARLEQPGIDVVLAESLDRLSRDQEHISRFYKLAMFQGARIITIADGEISEIHIGLKGTMSALFLKDLAQKTHRGMEGRVRAGQNGGGLSFGYRVNHQIGHDGTLTTGELRIEPSEAEIIRRVFESYVDGQSPRSIAKILNAEAIPGTRGGQWTASLLLGNATRETGVLRNRLYVGERVWNRQHFVKDPSSGKRVARPNPPAAWIVSAVPNLRIIEAPLWEAAQVRLAAGRAKVVTRDGAADSDEMSVSQSMGGRLAAARRPAWLLSGLVRCGSCDGTISVKASAGRLGCTNHYERGTCDNRRTILRDKLLPQVLNGLKERLLTPDLVEEFVRVFVAEVNAANQARAGRQTRVTQDRSKLERQIRNLLELIKDGHGSRGMVQELRLLERPRETMNAALSADLLPEPTPVLHPNLPLLYRRKVEALETALKDPSTAMLAAEAMRTLIDAIVIYPGAKRGEVRIELRGDLAAFMYLADGAAQTGTAVARKGNDRSGEVMGTLVAGTRCHLYRTTFRIA